MGNSKSKNTEFNNEEDFEINNKKFCCLNISSIKKHKRNLSQQNLLKKEEKIFLKKNWKKFFSHHCNFLKRTNDLEKNIFKINNEFDIIFFVNFYKIFDEIKGIYFVF